MQFSENISGLISNVYRSAIAIIMLVATAWPASSARFVKCNREPARDRSQFREFSYSQIHMAMEVRITVWWDNQQEVEAACKAAFRRIAQLEKIFSDYDPKSEVSLLTKQAVASPQPVSDELLHVLLFSQKVHAQSGGAFDPTVGPLIQLWREARTNQQLPNRSKLQMTRQLVGFEKVKIDQEQKTVQFEIPEMRLDFGGIAKGYIGDQVLELLKEHGMTIACYQAGGDFVLGDSPPKTEGWSVRLESGKVLLLSSCGIAVSGDAMQFVEIDGIRYSHVIDPRTGEAITTRRSATVIAPSGMQSDALATTGCVLDEQAFKKLLALYPNSRGWVDEP